MRSQSAASQDKPRASAQSNHRKDSSSDESESASVAEVENPSESSSEEEEVKAPAKKGPAFGAKKAVSAPKKHKYLEHGGRMAEGRAEQQRAEILGKRREHESSSEDEDIS